MSATGTLPKKALEPVRVAVSVDRIKNTISVHPEKFDVDSRTQELVLACEQEHNHGGETNACFIAHFVGASPFAQHAFTGPEAHSGQAVKGGLYTYTVWVPGLAPVLKQGGVHP